MDALGRVSAEPSGCVVIRCAYSGFGMSRVVSSVTIQRLTSNRARSFSLCGTTRRVGVRGSTVPGGRRGVRGGVLSSCCGFMGGGLRGG